eukprot:Blabericola_migrator_1__10872@NODE_626_length_7188_cov_20_892290_g457_i0_p2_GENE_NODE_626_length_7188_cov_20_892290_g457_i0NODE_626_length_7188_cov_20_892290_g457_i0_p2_ORF_typecomplete_len272_score67_19ATP_bind_1/PF03029_17/5_5e85GTP_EFTU/PF00009_27/0_001AAA_33/PF13671_6/0_00097Zeta_toxin/PF06414_12/0_0018Zeta_toxin/PF06414_12/3_1e03AAA/PF00004_29/0_0038PduVEutP/PF10662_9/0_22PduVEutP/PF10662_9/22NACHT/PF05729_12/0_0041NACHT/PF05729_12/1_9e03AAA_5/PF07728_14/0_0026AAA_16/PF13191_6/0_019AAA_16/P
MKYAQLVIGPAGCGKSTYCHTIQEHCSVTGRTCRVINLDPAAEVFKYDCCLDVRDLVTVEEVMEHLSYGPNGALLFAMEYLLKKYDWLDENFGDTAFCDDDYLLIDCPGQIELYTHHPVIKEFLRLLELWDYRVVAVYCMDVSFMSETNKFLSGAMTALSAMIMLELPHVNVLTKFDMLSQSDKENVLDLLEKSPSELITDLKKNLPKRYLQFNESLIQVLEEYSLVSFCVLDIDDEESIDQVLMLIDHTIQYGENLEPNDKFDMNAGHED